MLDTRVKERLTGAIILVALLVLLVPELLSGPGRSVSSAPPESADGAQMRSYTINLTDEANERRSVAAPVTEAPLSDVEPAEAAAERADAQTGGHADMDDARGTGSARVANAHASESEEAGSAAAPLTAGSEKPSASTPAARPESGWAVQLGSFASHDNALRLARELRRKGFAVIVSESSSKGRRLWRVRVGPESDRPAAVALDARLRSAGYKGGAVVSYP